MLTVCAVGQLFLGEWAARLCLQRYVGQSASCTDCFVDNIACTITHCYAECMLKGKIPFLSSANAEAGSAGFTFDKTQYDLNACFYCDEVHCSPTFVGRCAGANRRTAGVVTDVARPVNTK